ncbi:MAG: DCC1-like thiol-disulfide oxidoreductase family protein [Solirubrobacterales bacterium]
MQFRCDHALLDDGECGHCRLAVRAALALDRDRRLRPVAIQSEEGRRLLGAVPADRQLGSFHLLTPGGIVISGPDAVPALARLLPGGTVPARTRSVQPPASDE